MSERTHVKALSLRWSALDIAWLVTWGIEPFALAVPR